MEGPIPDAEEIRAFYNEYSAEREWARFDTPLGQVQLHVISRFLLDWVPQESRVLDVGSGPGRFAIQLARQGCRVALLDVSDTMIAAARERVRAAKVEPRVEGFHRASLFDIGRMDLGRYDVVLCLGGALNYYPEHMPDALRALKSALAPGGCLIGTVMSTVGALGSSLSRGWVPPQSVTGTEIRKVYETGMLTETLSPHRAKMLHADGLRQLLGESGLRTLDLSATECLLSLADGAIEALKVREDVYRTLLELEVDACRRMPDAGGHILFAAEPAD
jgi:2-polyprenyl-3-methyl-5-hydroxy-6-metoxy-1,4-benzoquinol methylase